MCANCRAIQCDLFIFFIDYVTLFYASQWFDPHILAFEPHVREITVAYEWCVPLYVVNRNFRIQSKSASSVFARKKVDTSSEM